MLYFEIILMTLFVVLTAIGYKKSNRNTMLVGSICLLVGLAGEPFMKGFNEGFKESREARLSQSQ